MTIASDFYQDGIIFGNFKNSSMILVDKIKEMSFHQKDGFSWETKYPNTDDFRPSVYEYDSIFVDILFDNDIHNFIKDATHKDLCLAHIQLRRAFPGPSYMNWHRDTHFKNRAVISCSPPAYKIIFFPDIYDKRDKGISVVKGSHLCHMVNQKESDFISAGFSQFDKQIVESTMFEKVSLYSSKDRFAFFDTSILHAACESSDDTGSLRLIYNFVDKHQFDSIYSHKKEHKELNDIFQSKKKGSQ